MKTSYKIGALALASVWALKSPSKAQSIQVDPAATQPATAEQVQALNKRLNHLESGMTEQILIDWGAAITIIGAYIYTNMRTRKQDKGISGPSN